MVSGGVESMSRAPWVMLKPEKPYARTHETMHSTTLGWRMVNPDMPDDWTVSLGEGAEILADRYRIARDEQDEFAVRSHRNAAAAWERGVYDDEVVPVPDTELERDETIRRRLVAGEAGQAQAGVPQGRHGDGRQLVSSERRRRGAAARRRGRREGARAASRWRGSRRARSAAIEPPLYGIGPVEAANKALARAGIGWDDLSLVELNEAFAAQSIACLREWTELDPEIVNPNGGAIAIGHPLGCSGARLLDLARARAASARGGGWGLATMCIGVGQGIAMVLEA